MPYPRPTLTTLLAQAKADITANLPIGGVLLPISNLGYTSEAIAGMSYDLYGLIDYYSLQATPLTATSEWLVAWASFKRVFREDATPSTGQVMLTGVAGTDVPAGTLLSRIDGYQYTTAADWQVGDATPLIVNAVVPGSAGNTPVGATLTLTVSIGGVSSTGVLVTALVGGADQETDDSLRSRMLAEFAAPAQGGNSSDFRNWLLQIPGVTRGWVNPLGAGPGTVVVYTMFDISEAANNGFPIGSGGIAYAETRQAYPFATGDLQAVASFLFPLAPVPTLVFSAAPTPQPINIAIQGLNPASSALQAAVIASIAELFVVNGSPLGSVLYLSGIASAIESTASVINYTLLSPATNVVIPVGYLPTVGTVTWS